MEAREIVSKTVSTLGHLGAVSTILMAEAALNFDKIDQVLGTQIFPPDTLVMPVTPAPIIKTPLERLTSRCEGSSLKELGGDHPVFKIAEAESNQIHVLLEGYGLEANLSINGFFVCEESVISSHSQCAAGGLAFTDDRNILFPKGSLGNSDYIAHEIAHLGDESDSPSWLRELAADLASERERSWESSYAINHHWGTFLSGDDVEKDILGLVYGENISESDLEAFLSKKILGYGEDISEQEFQEVLYDLQNDTPIELLAFTRRILEGSNAEFWKTALGINLSDIEKFLESRPCLNGAMQEATEQLEGEISIEDFQEWQAMEKEWSGWKEDSVNKIRAFEILYALILMNIFRKRRKKN